MLIVEALAEVGDSLELAGITSARAEARTLVAHALGTSLADLDTRLTFGFALSEEQLQVLYASLERRLKREPLQHITGVAGFRYLELSVGPGVFIPRPETETVAQLAIDYLSSALAAQALDVGCGSGAIAIAIATETKARVTAVELSSDAAEYALRNISKYAADVELRIGDFREQVAEIGHFDLVISNPPYIPELAIPIDPEVRDFDPPLALYSGSDGLDAIRDLVELAQVWLKPGGLLVLEHADGQSDEVVQLLLGAGFENARVHPDSTGRLRAVTASR